MLIIPSRYVAMTMKLGQTRNAIAILLALWAGFAALAIQRIHSPYYLAKCDFAARIIDLYPIDASQKKPDAKDVEAAIQSFKTQGGGRNFYFHGVVTDKTDDANQHQKFVAAAVKWLSLSKLQAEDSTSLADLNNLGMTFSDGPVPYEPSGFDRFQIDYVTTRGVEFRPWSDSVASRKEAAERFLNEESTAFNVRDPLEYPFPWRTFEFYDPMRVTLNQYIVMFVPLILFVASTLARFLYADVELRIGSKEPVKIRKLIRIWTSPSFKKGAAENRALRWAKVLDWAAVAVSAILVFVVELFKNNPEYRSEWIVNVPIMAIVGPTILVLAVCLVQFSFSTANSDLMRCKASEVKGFFKPLAAAMYSLLATASLTIMISWFNKQSNHDESFVERYYSQIGLMAVIIVLWLAASWKLNALPIGTPSDKANSLNRPTLDAGSGYIFNAAALCVLIFIAATCFSERGVISHFLGYFVPTPP